LDNFAPQRVSVSNEQHQILVQFQESGVYVLPFCPGHVSDLASILGTNPEKNCDFVSGHRRCGIGFGKFAQDNDLPVA
jgi:hypothetical protein